MTRKTAKDIFVDIYGDAEPEDKLTAIQDVLDGGYVSRVTKDELANVIRWLVEEYI